LRTSWQDAWTLQIKRYPKSIDLFVYGAVVGSAVIEKLARGSKPFWAVHGNHDWVLGRARSCS
jgi:hypothetical protein